MYNKEYKDAFINTLERSVESKYQYESMFKRVEPLENEIGKDLYDMNMDELETVFYKLRRRTKRSALQFFNLIKSYITWAKDNGYSSSKLHPIVDVINSEYVEKYIYKAGTNYYTREEILEGIQNLANARERALVLALFEGISGKKHSEIINLRAEDISEKDGQYYVSVLSDEIELTNRQVSISKELYELLIEAYETKETTNPRGGKSRVADGAYVFRRNRIRAGEDCKLRHQSISALYMGTIKNAFGDSNISATIINNSGLMYYANEIMGDKRVMDTEVAEKVAKRFDLTMSGYKGKVYTHYTRLRERIDVDYMIETYGDFTIDF